MSREQILEVLKLLSALEAWSFAEKHNLPDYLFERLDNSIEVLTNQVLK
jgi:hypothetical protein